MAAATYSASFQRTRHGWIGGPVWDSVWMFSALWGSGLLLLLSLPLGMGRAGTLLFVANMGLALVHSWSTTYLVLGSPLLRDARRKDRTKFLLVPLAIVIASFALGLAIGELRLFPTQFPLGSQHAVWALYLALFWVGHFWHFGNQDFGVLSLYRLKAGQHGARDRQIDKSYAVAMMFVIQPLIYLKAVGSSPLSEAFFSYAPVSREFVAAAARFALGAAIVCSALVIALELRKPDRSVPKLLYYAVMLWHPCVLYLLHWKLGFFYLIAYFWSHWLIAIGLGARIGTNFQRSRGHSPFAAVARHSLALGLIAGALLPLYLVFGWLSVFSGGDYKELLNSVNPKYSTVCGLLLGYFLAEQLLHYYCDRCLFRFRDPAVRQAVAPLI